MFFFDPKQVIDVLSAHQESDPLLQLEDGSNSCKALRGRGSTVLNPVRPKKRDMLNKSVWRRSASKLADLGKTAGPISPIVGIRV